MAESSLMERLKRRKVVQWAVAYAMVALGVMEFVDNVGARWGVTDNAQRLLDVVLVIGLGVTIVLAWFHGERGRQRIGALEVGALGVVLLAGAFLAGRMGDASAPESPAVLGEDGLAVRPLVDLSPGDEDESFAVSMHSELNSVLGRQLVTRVIATSAMRGYTDNARSSADIATELGVRHLLTGDVRVSGETVRLNVELVDRAGTFVWGKSYDAELEPSRMLAIQQEIATEIASELAIEMRDAEFATASGENAAAAYTLYQQGVARVQQADSLRGEARDAVWTLAIDLFHQATRLDPGFVPALAQQSIQLTSWVNRGYAPRSMTGPQIDSIHAIALELAERANALAPGNPDAITAMASYRYFVDRDYPTAINLTTRALALDPNNFDATLWRAAAHRRMGNLREAALGLERVTRLNPRSAQFREELSRTLGGDRRFAEALAVTDDLERLNASDAWSQRSNLAALLGDTAAIRRAAEACPECPITRLNAALYLEPHHAVTAGQRSVDAAYTAELSGDAELATTLYRQASDELEARVGLRGVWCPGSLCPNRIGEAGQLAFARAKLGDTAGARGALFKADSLAAVEPRDLWAAPDYTRWKLWTAVVLEDLAMWTLELEGLLSLHTSVEGIMTPALARLDPRLESVREYPGFEAIVGR